MNEKSGRHEIKYHTNLFDVRRLSAKLPYLMSVDENAGPDKSYRVRSLYFDNYNDKALREKLDGISRREKFRLRFYNDDPSFIRLEKKSKAKGLCYKETAPISSILCEEIAAGVYGGLKETKNPLHMELYTKLHCENLRPKNIVDYRREAYLYAAGNVRVTLDSDIRACTHTAQFLKPDMITLPLTGIHVLEVKYDQFLPAFIRDVVALNSRQATAFSKYAAARTV